MESMTSGIPVSELAVDQFPLIDDEQVKLLLSVADETGDELLRELLELFVDENGPRIGKIREALMARNRDEVLRGAHSVAGSSANLGGFRLAKNCSQLEGLAANGEFGGMEALFNQIVIDFDATVDAFRGIVDRLPSKG